MLDIISSRERSARAKVFATIKDNHMLFLNTRKDENVVYMIKEGVRFCARNVPAAEIGRKSSNRQQQY